jgi:hypothetical protein
MFMRRYSSIGRASRIATWSPALRRACRTSGVTCGVPQAFSTISPKALLGTFTPENSS